MVGVELADDKKTPLAKETQMIVEYCKDNGVIIGKGGLYGNVIRIKPPLIITKTDVDTLLVVLRKALEVSVKVAVS